MEITTENISEVLRNLPQDAGIYKYFSAEGEIIYVGKAKNLKSRVSSYFQKSNQLSRKTLRLVSEIRRIELTVVNTEMDAFLLENNLIKENQPKYNILLKDDKTYPYICITHERFPRVLAVRSLDRTLGTYYGPYASVKAMNTMLELFRELFPIRTCAYDLSEENIRKQKYKACLEYHIKKCKAPCEALQKEEEYNREIEQIRLILKGKMSIAKNYFKQKMQEAADAWAFEEAQVLKEKYEALDKFQTKSMVANPNVTDLDVFTISADEKTAYYNFFHIQNGCIVRTQTAVLKKKLDETDSTILKHLIVEFLENAEAKIITNVEPDEELLEHFTITVPKIGDLKQLIELSYKNVLYLKKEHLNRKNEQTENSTQKRVLETLQQDLRLLHLPKHIECFDNSNIQGTNPVASMVCFRDGKPAKKDYRHYNIKTVTGANDFASMHEIVTRRYKRLKEERQPLPNLIIVDGGKGQLSSAVEALKELELYGAIPIIGIAKRLEEIYYPEDEVPLYLSKKSESLRLIQRMRDEAHRFAITFHRQKRSNNSLISRLEEIDGIGEKTVKILLEKYKSVLKIKKISESELAELVGRHKASLVKATLEEEK